MRYDVLVLGGGSAGCVLAARLSEDEKRTVCLVEAGPDYGPRDGDGWPQELLDPGGIPRTHQWHEEESPYSPLRARVIGGCSAHNACLLVRAPPEDFDPWGDGWTAADLEPYLHRAQQTIAPRPLRFTREEFSPWFAGVVDAGTELGLPLLGDFNEPVRAVGTGVGPLNIVDGARWNAAFAYLDPARERPNLTVMAGTLVDRVRLEGERAAAVVTSAGELEADTFVLAAGACGSPPVLLRSGIGPEADLRSLGIEVAAPLPVGANLVDHATTWLVFEPSEAMRAETLRDAPVSLSNGVMKARTELCQDDAFDIHILPITSRVGEDAHLTVALMQPESRGQVRLRSADPAVAPEVDHRLLSDAGGKDRETLRAGLAVAQRLAETEQLRRLGRPVQAHDESIDSTLGIYFHPVGTCALGAVVDRDCRVRGFENLYVADASIMPTIPRANTHLTTLAIAEKVAEAL